MKSKTDIIFNFLFEINGQYDEHLFTKLEEFCDYMQKKSPSIQMFNFKSKRLKVGLTLREVEEKTGISNAYLSQLENGKIKAPSFKIVETLFLFYNAR